MFKTIHVILLIAALVYCFDIDLLKKDPKTKCPNPINTCERGKISFYLYTELLQPYEELLLNDEDSIKNAPFIPKADFKILIHGYIGSKERPPALVATRNEYLKLKKHNILVVDWGALAIRDCYFDTAFPSIPLVGKCCAEFVNSILRYRPETNENQFHIVAVSMGCHIAAHFGNNFRPKVISRITGLDPAFPKFEPPFTSPHSILNREHAKFVDVMHSNMGIFGVYFSNGTYDIYAGDGVFQPGCKLTDIGCHHRRVAEVFAESINSKVKFMAKKCAHNWSFVTFRKCDGNSKRFIEVGEHCLPPSDEKYTGTYHFHTNDHPPYAKGDDQD